MLEGMDSEEVESGLRQLEAGYRHLVWDEPQDDVSQKASPFWGSAGDIPKFVKATITRALNSGALFAGFDDMDTLNLRRFFKQNLTESAWSIRTLSEQFADQFGVDEDRADTIVRSETSEILNKAREYGYESTGDTDERKFKWIGPDDHRTTDACEYIKKQSQDGVSLRELKNLIQKANKEYVDSHGPREWSPHINCRHTYVEVYN